jgi:hypothetical protein
MLTIDVGTQAVSILNRHGTRRRAGPREHDVKSEAAEHAEFTESRGKATPWPVGCGCLSSDFPWEQTLGLANARHPERLFKKKASHTPRSARFGGEWHSA